MYIYMIKIENTHTQISECFFFYHRRCTRCSLSQADPEPGSDLTPDKTEDEWTSSEALRKDMAETVSLERSEGDFYIKIS